MGNKAYDSVTDKRGEMNREITEEPAAVRLRHTIKPSIWRRLSLLEKIAIVQLAMAGCTFLLLVLLVAGS